MSRHEQPSLAAQRSSLDKSRQLLLRSPRVSTGAAKSGRAALESRQEKASLAVQRSGLGQEHPSLADSTQVSKRLQLVLAE